jgi:hypothetical protein
VRTSNLGWCGRAAAAALLFSGVCVAQDVVKPEVKVDERWVYRRTDPRAKPPTIVYELRASFVDARTIHTIVERQGGQRDSDATWTPEWNNVVSGDGTVFVLEKGMFQFPLSVGREYPSTWENKRPRSGTFHVKHERTVKVVGWEEIEVPAGKFRALKVHAEGTYQRLDRPNSGWARNTFWYVPTVKRWVKSVYQDPTLEIVEELYFYRVQ